MIIYNKSNPPPGFYHYVYLREDGHIIPEKAVAEEHGKNIVLVAMGK